MKRMHVCLVVASLVSLLWQGVAVAQSESAGYVPFGEFVESVSLTTFDDYVLCRNAGVRQRAEFERMRAHILSMYKGVDVEHSYVMDSQHFDCVPVEQQPSVRLLGLKTIALVPPAPLTMGDSESAAPENIRRLASPLTLGLEDAFGNAIHCDPGTIPMRRLTLEEMSRFGSLEGFFEKIPFGQAGKLQNSGTAAAAHKYAHAYQKVKNYGGNSWLNIWNPLVNESAGQIFSLS